MIPETGIVKALGLYRSGAVLMREKDAADGGAQMPLYVANKNIKPFVDNELAAVLQKPIWYTPPGSGNKNKGAAAEVLPQICACGRLGTVGGEANELEISQTTQENATC